jgi:uncharacterized OB-fold protein
MTELNPGIAISAIATYLPRFRLTGAEINRALGKGGGKGQRSIAGPDEDALTLAIEAARRLPDDAMREVQRVVFCSTSAPYLVKNNASAAVAVLGLNSNVMAYDAGGSFRSSVGQLLAAQPGTLILAGDVNTSRPGSPNELSHGDAGAAVIVGELGKSQAEITHSRSETEEIQDHWRVPKNPWMSQSEDRFPISSYLRMLTKTLSTDVLTVSDFVVVSTPSVRVANAAEKQMASAGLMLRSRELGFMGAADQLVRICDALSQSDDGQTVLVILMSDGCDVLKIVANDVNAKYIVPAGDAFTEVNYLDALTWRSLLEREPPRRPEPKVVSAPAALRGTNWKYSLIASSCSSCGFISTPPQEICLRCGSAEHEQINMANRVATIRTFSVDRLAYSLNPPMVAAVVGFDGGGRLEVEMTDSRLDAIEVGAPVRMTFRRRHSSGGVHNYVWKAIIERTDA